MIHFSFHSGSVVKDEFIGYISVDFWEMNVYHRAGSCEHMLF